MHPILLLCLLFSFSAHAATQLTSLSFPCANRQGQCPGPHYPLFTVRNSMAASNITVVYTKLDRDCRIMHVKGKPVLDFYVKKPGQTKEMDQVMATIMRDVIDAA